MVDAQSERCARLVCDIEEALVENIGVFVLEAHTSSEAFDVLFQELAELQQESDFGPLNRNEIVWPAVGAFKLHGHIGRLALL